VIEDEPTATAVENADHAVRAEISGNVWKVLVAEGATVAAGETFLVLEAMKMEFAVIAPVSGIVRTLQCRSGRPVDAGALLATIAPL